MKLLQNDNSSKNLEGFVQIINRILGLLNVDLREKIIDASMEVLTCHIHSF